MCVCVCVCVWGGGICVRECVQNTQFEEKHVEMYVSCLLSMMCRINSKFDSANHKWEKNKDGNNFT